MVLQYLLQISRTLQSERTFQIYASTIQKLHYFLESSYSFLTSLVLTIASLLSFVVAYVFFYLFIFKYEILLAWQIILFANMIEFGIYNLVVVIPEYMQGFGVIGFLETLFYLTAVKYDY